MVRRPEYCTRESQDWPNWGVASYKGAGVLGRRRAARSGSTRVAEGSIGSSFSLRNLMQQFDVFKMYSNLSQGVEGLDSGFPPR